MKNNTIVTYSLLTHLKESKYNNYSSISELFFPIVKKALVEYAKEYGDVEIKGKNISEIKLKINDFFGIDIPLGVLDFILSQISKEINNEGIFAYYKDKSFIIKAFTFYDIDSEIQLEAENINLLKDDFAKFCNALGVTPDFDELITFICSQKMELFSDKKLEDLGFNFFIPKYLSLKFLDDKIFKIISDIYLGSIISSYFEYKINTPVADTELLIDTNYFISLINLNTEEAFYTCNQLHDICLRLGYRFTILYSTVDQIKSLLSNRIYDFANKDVGLVKEADIFGACIRRKLNKTQLERIKDNIEIELKKYNIQIIHNTQIKDLVNKAQKSTKYKELLEIRYGNKPGALNDTIAYIYVSKKRGADVQEFADVKCWFLNNTYHSDYFIGKGYSIHERYKINANELLSLLWLSNPDQKMFDLKVLSKGGLATFIAKYKHFNTPSINTIKNINYRAKKALEQGELSDKDVFAISIRMAEGQLTSNETEKIKDLPDEDFIKIIKEFTINEEKIISKLDTQNSLFEQQRESLESLKEENAKLLYNIELERFEKNKVKYIDTKIRDEVFKMNKVAWSYLLFVIIVSVIWLLNYLSFKIFKPEFGVFIAFSLFLSTLFIRFIEHKSVLKCIKFTFIKSFRNMFISKLRNQYEKEFTTGDKEPIKLINKNAQPTTTKYRIASK